MSFVEFQDGCRLGHLGYQNGTILAILNPCLPNATSPLIRPFWSRCGMKTFKMATMAAILDIDLDLHVFLMPPTNFGLNPTYLPGADAV